MRYLLCLFVLLFTVGCQSAKASERYLFPWNAKLEAEHPNRNHDVYLLPHNADLAGAELQRLPSTGKGTSTIADVPPVMVAADGDLGWQNQMPNIVYTIVLLVLVALGLRKSWATILARIAASVASHLASRFDNVDSKLDENTNDTKAIRQKVVK